MSEKIHSVCSRLFLRMSGIVTLAVLWELLPSAGLVNKAFLPPLSKVLDEAWRLILTQHLLGHTLATLWRITTGVVITGLLAIPAGIILGYWLPGLADKLNPLFRILAQVNPFSLLTVFLLFLGVGEGAKVVVVIWASFWPMIGHTIEGMRTIDPDLLKTADSMGISKIKMFGGVLLPAALPAILLGLRSSILVLFFILVAGEMLGGGAGLGWLIHWASNYYQYPYAALSVYAVGLSISLLAVAISAFLRLVERDLLFWKEPASLWGTASAAQPSRRAASRYFKAAALTATLLVLFLGGLETGKMNKAMNTIGGEGGVSPVESPGAAEQSPAGDHTEGHSPNQPPDLTPSNSGHSNHSNHSGK